MPPRPRRARCGGASLEDETCCLEADEVAGPVGPVPAERRQGRILLGILRRIEISRETDAADDELAGAALGHRHPLGVDDGERPAVQRQADAHRAFCAERRGARDDGGLGRAVGIPDLPTVRAQAGRELGRARLAAEDQQPHVLDRLAGPHGRQRRDRRDDGDALTEQPGCEVLAGAHERAWRRYQARAVPPREPHLLARGVEGDGEPREHPVVGAERRVLQEDPRLRVDEGRGRAVAHGDALRDARRPGGEDDPGVVVDRGRRHRDDRMRRGVRRVALEQRGRGGTAGHARSLGVRVERAGCRDVLPRTRDDPADGGFAEHQPGALVGIVGIDGHVRRTRGEDAEDRDVQLFRARRHSHPDAVTATDPRLVQPRRRGADPRHQLPVAQGAGAVVDRRGLRVTHRRGPQHVEERARRRRVGGAVEERLAWCRHVRTADRSAAPSSGASTRCDRPPAPAPAAARRSARQGRRLRRSS